MSLYLVTGLGASTAPTGTSGDHLSTDRPRRYPSDTSDAEWEITAPYIPVGGTRLGAGGRPVSYPRRDIVDAIRYLDHNGGVWRGLPADFPPWRTVYHYFRQWDRDGTLNRLHNGLREQVRLADGRKAEPSAAILDSQSVRAAETVAQRSRGFDGGKKTSDARTLSSSELKLCLGARWEGGGFVVEDALGEAVVKAADQAVEEVALGGGVPVVGFTAAVVVGSGAV